jgi:hypothetical protein
LFIFEVRFAVTFISIYVYDLPCFLVLVQFVEWQSVGAVHHTA